MISLYYRYLHGSLSYNSQNHRLYHFFLMYIVFTEFFLSFLMLFYYQYRSVFHYDCIFRATVFRSLQTTVGRKLSQIYRSHASIDILISSIAEFSFFPATWKFAVIVSSSACSWSPWVSLISTFGEVETRCLALPPAEETRVKRRRRRELPLEYSCAIVLDAF